MIAICRACPAACDLRSESACGSFDLDEHGRPRQIRPLTFGLVPLGGAAPARHEVKRRVIRAYCTNANGVNFTLRDAGVQGGEPRLVVWISAALEIPKELFQPGSYINVTVNSMLLVEV